MRVAMIGAGYVGLVSAACFSEFGFSVTCVEASPERLATLRAGHVPIYEPGLERLVAANVAARRLSFTSEIEEAVPAADVVMLAVGTPSRRGDGYADLSFVHEATGQVADMLEGYTVVATKSTVPVGTGRKIGWIIRERRPDAAFDVVSNPEFLREGSAIDDFMRPDRVIVGVESSEAQAVMRALYRPLFLIETPVLFTSLETAELIKYAANCFLATKITFINEIADICERIDADVQDVARGMGLDGRIGRYFLHAGPGFGGSCFPKDAAAFAHIAREAGAPCGIVETVLRSNTARKAKMTNKIVQACGGSVAGKTVAVLGVTFKPNTDDVRESPSLVILPGLAERGAAVRAFDPAGMDEARSILGGVDWCGDAYDAMADADALVILTEWNEFRALDLARVKGLMRTPLIVDLRNIYEPEEVAAAGFRYVSIGRPKAESSAETVNQKVRRLHATG
ncbi:MAG: UDP-glucose/GDP-mannose dehydrogenase family protein [Rhodospirillales bacterium]|nr:UDP-glucose/GDP-mannose dehydrogenase family protein [Rhodospirillales bacterium]MDE0380778.1 UDP-glucose/GDP-mannose dehydrogenase family protein [Rhodospirillales bacterium]